MGAVIRLVQLQSTSGDRRTGLVQDESIRLIGGCRSIHELALRAIRLQIPVEAVTSSLLTGVSINYDEVYALESEWRLAPPLTHPDDPARCLVSGTGLTHKTSAMSRQAMHAKPDEWSDSMKMYQRGVEGGRPAPGEIGAEPEWFYKGCGTILRAHGEPLSVPPFALDGGEEPEIVGAYVIDDSGRPWRVGFTVGNEFSDHRLEKQNYLYLAHSKLRTCSIGPELAVGAAFDDVRGTVTINRAGNTVWSKGLASGEANMCHSLANLEHHHFKYGAHRRPGDAHIHFFGASAFSFGEGVTLQDGDDMVVEFEGLGRPLRNPLRVESSPLELVGVRQA